MLTAETVVRELEASGDLWDAGPGLIGLRGATLALFGAIERAILDLAREEAPEEWRVPAALAFETLGRADYFASFPQWLTLASHFPDDEAALERVATSADPGQAARHAAAPAEAALPPAVCYHAYAALAGRTLRSPTIVTAQGTCWRHERARLAPLERGWAFTMREIVCLGGEQDTADFRARMTSRAGALATALGLEWKLAEAADPFFAPTARGKALLQKVKALKHELLLAAGPEHQIAAASINHHERFFGEAFAIRLVGGEPAGTACAAFGIERWTLAFLCTHGLDPLGWPAIRQAEIVAGVTP